MARTKTDAERGALGAWAYNTRVLLGLSSEEVAHEVGAHNATIRKIEGGSGPKPSADLLRRLYLFYRDRAGSLPIEPPPGLGDTEKPGPSEEVAGLLLRFVEALEVQARYLTQLEDLRAELAETRRESEEQRVAQAELLGQMAAELHDLRSLAGMPAGSSGPDPATQN